MPLTYVQGYYDPSQYAGYQDPSQYGQAAYNPAQPVQQYPQVLIRVHSCKLGL